MHYIHYTEEFKNNIKGYPFEQAVYDKMETFSVIEKPEALNTISRHAKDIFVYKKNNSCRVIIEKRNEIVEGSDVSVFFIRDFISNQQFDYYWTKRIYPQIKDGTWLEENPLDELELNQFITDYTIRIIENKLPPPPETLNSWLRTYRLNITFNIYEKEAWVDYSTYRGKKGLEEKFILSFKKLFKGIFEESPFIITRSIDSKNVLKSAISEDDAGIIYSKHEFNGNTIVFIHGGAHTILQKQQWEELIKDLRNQNLVYNNIKEIGEDSVRAYPKWVFNNNNNEDDLWCLIQRSKGINNLALLPEQVDFLSAFRFPSYINGQAGSGKSTMLYYLFANVYYYKAAEELTGEIIFLTENPNLLQDTKKSVINLLQLNPQFDGIDREGINRAGERLSLFKDFLISFLPKELSNDYPDHKYLDFPTFKSKFLKSRKQNKFSAEEIWFVISTYVYGYYKNRIIDNGEAYINEEKGIPRKFRQLSKQRFDDVIKEGLPFYERLLNDGWWDKNTLARLIYKIYPNTLPKTYTVIFCDEAQDFSRIELSLILRASEYLKYDLSNPGQQIPIVFSGDALQTVNPTGFSVIRMHQMFYDVLNEKGYTYDKSERTYNPTYNYRSILPIVRIANLIQCFRSEKITGEGKKQEAKMGKKSRQLPVLYSREWLLESENNDKFVEKFKHKSFIIPVDLNEEDSYKEKDELLGDNFIDVKSSIAAKGAEYSQVVVSGFGDWFLQEFSKSVTEVSDDFRNKFFFNKLYVAITRAQKELVIIDSEKAISSFWTPVFNFSNTVNGWENFATIDDVIHINPKTFDYTIDSEKEDAYQNACTDLELGIRDKNISRMKIASNIFFMLDENIKGYEGLANVELIKENWEKAAESFIKANNIDKAAEVLFKKKMWSELRFHTISLKSKNQSLRILISNFIQNKEWTNEEIIQVSRLRNQLGNVIDGLPWRVEFIDELSEFTKLTKNKQSKRDLAYIMEAIIRDDDYGGWESLGYIYYDTKQYAFAIDSWNRAKSEDELNKLEFYPFYQKAHFYDADDQNDVMTKLLWGGRILFDNQKKVDSSKSLISFLLKEFEESIDSILENKVSPEILENIYHAALLDGDEEKIMEVGQIFENKIIDKSIIRGAYQNLILKHSDNEQLSIYLKERWAKTYWEILILYLNPDDAIVKLNEKYQNKKFPFDNGLYKWTKVDVELISENPSTISSLPFDTIRDVQIRDFRGLRDIRLKNLGKFNLVLGNNNSGKTSLLEALTFTPSANITAGNFCHINDLRNGTLEDFWISLINRSSEKDNIQFTFTKGLRKWDFILRRPTVKELIEHTSSSEELIDNYVLIENVLNKKKNMSHSIIQIHQKHDVSEKTNINSNIGFIPFGRGYDNKLTQLYYENIQRKRELRKNFITNLRLFIPQLDEVIIDPGKDILMIEEIYEGEGSPPEPIPLHNYGDGANKLFRILVEVASSKGGRLMIDEIDAGIHYSKFKDFWVMILKTALEYDVQIFATTHNMECIKFFRDALDELGDSSKEEARFITLERHLRSKEIVALVRDFDSLEYAFDINLEMRGRDE